MIHLIIGKQGSGKTLYLVKKAFEAYEKGLTVYSNVHLKFPYKPLDYQEIIDCKLENGIVIIDEVHQLLPARRSMSKVNQEVCDSFLSMVRKKGLNVYGTTQTERKVDIRFREERDYFYIATKHIYNGKEWVEYGKPEALDKKIPIMIKLDVWEMYYDNNITLSFYGNPYFKLYDTNQIIRIKGLKV